MIQEVRRRYWDVLRAIAHGRASAELSRLGLKFIPWSRSAMQPAAVMTLLNEVIINRRETVVEFGCGVSTIFLARVLSEQGGRLISFEDNVSWAELVRALLRREGLSDAVTLVDAPLKPAKRPEVSLPWYDEESVANALVDLEIDLAVVDGPPAYAAGMGLARYPAYPAIASRMAPRSAIILDDIGRRGEQEVLSRWRTSPGFDFQVSMPPIANFAVCRRGQFFESGY